MTAVTPGPGEWAWAFEPDDNDWSRIDEMKCAECGVHVGAWVDADDTGRTIGGFVEYAYVVPTDWDDRASFDASLRCEDCARVSFNVCDVEFNGCVGGIIRHGDGTIRTCDVCHGHGMTATFFEPAQL